MPINLQGSGPITEGWGRAPELQGRDLGHTVAAIMAERLRREEDQQKILAEGIKRFQEGRQDDAYVNAAQAAGLLPQGDLGAIGAAGGSNLAKLIAAKQEDAAKEAYMRPYYEAMTKQHGAMADYIAAGKPPGVAAGVDLQEHALGDIWTDPDTGITMRQTTRGPQPVAAAIQPTSVRPPSEADTYRLENQLMQQKTLHEALSAAEAEKNAAAHPDVKASNIPYSHADDYNAIVKRLEELRAMRTQSQTSGGGQSSPYATPDQIKMARARQAMDDPQATPQEKEQARKILAGE